MINNGRQNTRKYWGYGMRRNQGITFQHLPTKIIGVRLQSFLYLVLFL